MLVQYKLFLHDYENAGHIEKIDNTNTSPPIIYIQHHYNGHLSSTTIKLCVVFDGSSRIDRAHIQHLVQKSKLQCDIISILNRFHFYQYIFTAGIKQITIHPEDHLYQCVVWRDHPSQIIQLYQLNTVTYGLVTSPYLALQILHQQAYDEQQSHLIAYNVLTQDFYFDEIMTGAGTLEEASNLQLNLINT